jgi:hypothetical protein
MITIFDIVSFHSDGSPPQQRTIDDPDKIKKIKRAWAEAQGALVSAAMMRKAFALTRRRLTTILRQHPEIQTWRPRANGLDFHLGDFLRCYNATDNQLRKLTEERLLEKEKRERRQEKRRYRTIFKGKSNG